MHNVPWKREEYFVTGFLWFLLNPVNWFGGCLFKKCSNQNFFGTPYAIRNVIQGRRCKSRTPHHKATIAARNPLLPERRGGGMSERVRASRSINHHHQLHSQCRRLRTDLRTAAKDIHNNRDITREDASQFLENHAALSIFLYTSLTSHRLGKKRKKMRRLKL